MTTAGGRRDLEEFGAGLAAWLHERQPEWSGLRIVEMSHPKAGFSNETILVTTEVDDGARDRIVVRLPPLLTSFPDHDFAAQALVAAAAAAGGVPTAEATVERDERFIGSPFIVMPFIDGTIPGPATVFDADLLSLDHDRQRRTQTQMIDTLATLHRLDWRPTALSGRLRGNESSLRDEVTWWRDYLVWAGEGSPNTRFIELVEWCEQHCPATAAEPSLLWGDARLENMILDDERRTIVVLDWELATIGPAEMDLAWFLSLEKVLRRLSGGMTVPGFRDDDEFVADYEAALGRPVEHLAFHEIFAVVRSICINYRQASLAAEAGTTYPLPADETNPLVGIVESWMADLDEASSR